LNSVLAFHSPTAPIRILVDSFADAGLPNAQMGNAREIVSRLDPHRFHVTMFRLRAPDLRIARRANTVLIQLPERRQTLRILREFLWGPHHLLFYLKSAPASRWYLNLRRRWNDCRTTIGTLESQSDAWNEPSLAPEGIRLWENTVLRCDYLYSNSGSVQKSLEQEYGLQSEIIPTGVDTSFFVPALERAPNPRQRVLFAGSLRTYKQPDVVVEAARRFPQADFRIVGEGPLAPELTKRIEELQLRNVSLTGLLSAEKLREEYRAADIFLFPSRWEGSPKVILEASACGLPVIARNDYSPETVIHGVTGFQAASNEEVFDYLGRLLVNPQLGRELGKNARRHSTNYDWNVITAQWEEVFIRLAGLRAQARAS